MAFMRGQGIRHIVIEMQGTKKVEIPQTIMHSIMEIALNEANHPLLIHCNHGKVCYAVRRQVLSVDEFHSTELAVP